MASSYKVRGLKELQRTINKILDDDLVKAGLLEEIARFVVERIQAFTRSGKSIAGINPRKINRLKESTIKSRARSEAKGNVDKEFFFGPSFSNLTETGQLLRSLKEKTDKAKKSILIKPEGKRDDGLSNEDVARYVAEGGRPFIGLDNRGIARVKRMVLTELRKRLRSKKL